MYADVPTPCSHALQALTPSSEFISLLALSNVSDAVAAVVSDPAAFSGAIDAAVTVAATAVPTAQVSPAFHDFGCVDIFTHMNSILRIYC